VYVEQRSDEPARRRQPACVAAMKLDLLRVVLPLLLVGFAAGGLRAAAQRARDPAAQRVLMFSWIALLLFGVPLWLFLAATIGWL
jgi:hypothetical protein